VTSNENVGSLLLPRNENAVATNGWKNTMPSSRVIEERKAILIRCGKYVGDFNRGLRRDLEGRGISVQRLTYQSFVYEYRYELVEVMISIDGIEH
jgi:hypothetical protein